MLLPLILALLYYSHVLSVFSTFWSSLCCSIGGRVFFSNLLLLAEKHLSLDNVWPYRFKVDQLGLHALTASAVDGVRDFESLGEGQESNEKGEEHNA